MIRFYSPDIELDSSLPESESAHCVRVLRHRTGDTIQVVDGKGSLFECEIIDANPKRTQLRIKNKIPARNPWRGSITLGIAPTKNIDRMEWLVEKLTEIGIDRIVPIKCNHSERKDIKIERLIKIAVAAMKQSLKTVLPVIEETARFNDFIDRYKDIPGKFIAYCDVAQGKKLFCKELEPDVDTVIVIGPEGDFSKEEIEYATANGFVPVSLGECRLRTETAALVAVDTIHIKSSLLFNS